MNRNTVKLIARYDRAVATVEDTVIQSINSSLNEAYKALEVSLRREYGRANPNLLATQRQAVLLNDLKSLLNIIQPSPQLEQSFTELITQARRLGVELATAELQDLEMDLDIISPTVDPLVLRTQVESAYKYLLKYGDEFLQKTNAILGLHLSIGSGVPKVVRALRNELGVTKTKAETLVRTQSQTAFNGAIKDTYIQSDIKQVQWIATVDTSVCPFCASRNMKVYNLNDVVLPLHPRDRCTISPWLDELHDNGMTDVDLMTKLRQDAITKIKAEGKEPDAGVGPFEKAAGLTKAPIPYRVPYKDD